MNYEQTTGESIRVSFNRFHRENPQVYDMFKQYAQVLLDTGATKLSSKLIINRIRWEIYIETTGSPYKINDAYTAWYARKFCRHFPQYKSYFEFRRIRATG